MEGLLTAMVCRRLDHFGTVDAADQEADAAVDLAQPLLAVQIVTVLGTVAVGGCPRRCPDFLLQLTPYIE